MKPTRTVIAKGGSEATLFSQARDIAFVAAIFLFFLGFSYERELLSLFGVASLSDQSPVYFITFSFDALEYASHHLSFAYAAVAALVVTALVALQFVDHLGPVTGKSAGRAAALLAIVSAFPAIHYYAFDASRNAASHILGGGGIVVAVSKTDSVPAGLQKDNEACLSELSKSPLAKDCHLRLVHEDDNVAYVCDAHLSNALGRTFEVVKKDGVSIIRVSRP